MQEFDRSKLKIKSLKERESKVLVSDMINPEAQPLLITEEQLQQIKYAADKIKQAKENNAPIIVSFGAHLIKNGLGKIMIDLIEKGYVSQLLGNGACSIHDWELAYQGKTSEDIGKYVSKGEFGMWEETGKYLNLAINYGAENNLGYGESVGKLIYEEKIDNEEVPHLYKDISVFASAYKNKVPFSISSNIGNDIFHEHPLCCGESLGKTSYKDFLRFVNTVSNIENGVLISIGSAVTAPMCFEKALSMSKNLAIQNGKGLENYTIVVVDIQPSNWDWSIGEPPMDNPSYYLRFFKTFSRMGGVCKYVQLDNRAFLHNLYKELVS